MSSPAPFCHSDSLVRQNVPQFFKLNRIFVQKYPGTSTSLSTAIGTDSNKLLISRIFSNCIFVYFFRFRSCRELIISRLMDRTKGNFCLASVTSFSYVLLRLSIVLHDGLAAPASCSRPAQRSFSRYSPSGIVHDECCHRGVDSLLTMDSLQ